MSLKKDPTNNTQAHEEGGRASINPEKGSAKACGRGRCEEEEGKEEEGGAVKKRIKKERPGVTPVDCIEYWQGYGRLWTSEIDDRVAVSKTKEAQRKYRGLQFVADVVGHDERSVMELKRKWNTIFGNKVPINYRLYEWLDPRFAPQWEESIGVVYLKTTSPIRANHSLGKFLIFKKAQ
jgi:hypothetical protein